MPHPLKISAISLISFSILGMTAHAEWKVGNLLPEGEEPNSEVDGLYLLAENETGPSVMLGCSDRLGVQAKIYLDGMTQDALAHEPVRNVKTRMVEIDTESTDPKKDVWAYLRTKGQLISVKPWQGKRIYNAAVKGENVGLEIRKIGTVSIAMPAINDDFKTFASTCDATVPKGA